LKISFLKNLSQQERPAPKDWPFVVQQISLNNL
jgi:hypothetical protein